MTARRDTKTMTAHDVTAMLRRHYLPDNRPPGGVFAPEIGSPCGKRRADLIWLPTTIAGGRGLIGHEIKVTRSDLLAELADPTKADPWARYCTRWWLVVADPTVVDGLTIPDAWGLMSPPSGRRTRSMTIHREAPKLTPHDPGPALMRVITWLLYGTQEQLDQARHERRADQQRIRALEAEIAALRANGSRMDPNATRLANILELVRQRVHDEFLWRRDVPNEVIAATIVDHLATASAAASARDSLRAVIRDVRRMVDPFTHTIRDLEKAEKLAAGLASDQTAGGAS